MRDTNGAQARHKRIPNAYVIEKHASEAHERDIVIFSCTFGSAEGAPYSIGFFDDELTVAIGFHIEELFF